MTEKNQKIEGQEYALDVTIIVLQNAATFTKFLNLLLVKQNFTIDFFTQIQ